MSASMSSQCVSSNIIAGQRLGNSFFIIFNPIGETVETFVTNAFFLVKAIVRFVTSELNPALHTFMAVLHWLFYPSIL